MLEWILDNWRWLIGAGSPLVLGAVFVGLRGRTSDLYKWARWGLRSGLGGISVGTVPMLQPKPEDMLQPKPEWYEVLQEELDRLPMGKVAFNPPDTMKVGVKERIEARISKDLDADLMASLRGRGLPQVEELRISELMKVRLSGDDFGIVPLSEENQIIEPTGLTEWAWDVTPRKSGEKILHLHVTLRIRLPYGEERKDHPVLDREILVQVNRGYSVKSFIGAHWKWIVLTLLLPLGGWVVRTLFWAE